ncbi:hypothetical protein QBC32DRAFT_336326 [Pseudoneurospora amorphoporcata]|uniref:Uncharacterized protein n=1 Tax=Pseudoneurospora amorphoporcata TaxID=241081 RepID=A0AAN6SHE1_9PEZI|nr:hypothetical protein QBC32DRAFT_336326 [Pseudoneurospora amorphoporcata]
MGTPKSEQGVAPSSGPPYLPPYAPVGGIPSFKHDLVPCIIFLIMFFLVAAVHMILFQLNRRRGIKFVFSALLFGFCMARITAVSMRLVWASDSDNPRLAIAANVFILLGGVIIVIVNLFFTQRLLRAIHPRQGWKTLWNNIFWGLLISIVSALIIIIAATVHFFFTLDTKTRYAERILLLTCSTWLTSMSFLPLVASGYFGWCIFKPAVDPTAIEDFGTGSVKRKIRVLLFGSLMATLGTGFRLGANFAGREIGHATWYHSHAAFYVFNFTIEILTVVVYAAFRIDKLFWVPDGARGPGDYNREPEESPPQTPPPGTPPGPPPGAPPGDQDRPDAPPGQRRGDIHMEYMDNERVGRPATAAKAPNWDQTAVQPSDASDTTKTPGQSLSPVSSRPLLAGSPTTAPETSMSESGAQASSSAATGIRAPAPSSSQNEAPTAPGSESRQEGAFSSLHVRAAGAARAAVTAGPADNGQDRHVHFKGQNEEPGGVIEGDGEGVGGSSGQPSIRPASSVYSTDGNGNNTVNERVTSWEPS